MISHVTQEIQPLQEQLLSHPLYKEIKTPDDLLVFMEHHVYAVWDFMSLLKALQNGLTCTQTPWKPVGSAETRYLINEIVLAEETDINAKGERQSHYEMYIDAMQKAGASTVAIDNLVATDFDVIAIHEAIENLPASVRQFLKFTFDIIDRGNLHEIAAAFTFGRENLIPAMFTAIIGEIEENFPAKDLSDFKYYFDRHIELDEDEHGPMALKMIEHLCGDDNNKWDEVVAVSKEALKVRLNLWDGILSEIKREEVYA